ncbi:DNA-protecting protein DprA [candidate division KSB3 bacterium]|uniref:DNA-protecting protein DprA n=1 Tax=candidate division KSB3 bacterium TaxID=2044937 RepID=A0A9D5Q7R8_9BACT|nr:DNA-protecting protein DprA [candidate division KSB3 bacterium]MBD3327180.1 DNA-protecting protein DprA [candidate division KSB3 bacterium]
MDEHALDAKKSWIALNMVPGVGAVNFRKLLNALGSPEHVFSASISTLMRIPGIHEKTARKIKQFGFPDHVARELEAIKTHQVTIITLEDPEYPEQLKTIFDPPPLLYVKGHPLRRHEPMIAVVGCRKASTYGRTVTEKLCGELAVKGLTVISGMARGIDSAAHRGTLKAGGRTIAVLGCGVDVVYPPENTPLYREIIEKGSVISEFPMHTKPDRGNFPARNRVISGMSLGTVVVEAGNHSGALITADTALEQGRDVFAVPGNVTSAGSKGTNRLIKQGATLIEHADDVLNALPLEISREVQGMQPDLPLLTEPQLPTLTPDEHQIFTLITHQPIHIDEITIRAQLPSSQVSATLMMLEMKNAIRQIAGKMFVRV